MSAMSAHRRVRTVLVAAVVLLTGWFLAPGAVAHDVLIDSSPADGEVLTEAPESITLTFNNAPLDVGSVIVVEDADGETVAEGEGVAEGTDVSLELTEPLTNGDYTAVWRIASSDGHPLDGRIPFTVEAPEPEPTTEEPTEEPVTEEPTQEPVTEDTVEETTEADPEPATSAEAPAEDNGGLPTWAFVVIAVAVLGAIGAVIATTVRRRGDGKDDTSV